MQPIDHIAIRDTMCILFPLRAAATGHIQGTLLDLGLIHLRHERLSTQVLFLLAHLGVEVQHLSTTKNNNYPCQLAES